MPTTTPHGETQRRTRFERWVKYNLDFPHYDCRLCQQLADEGEPIELPCEGCPRRVLGEIDACTELALQARSLLLDHPLGGEHPPPLEFIFQLLGLQTGRTVALEVYRRLQDMERILREHRELEREEDEMRKKGQPPHRKGHE